MLNGLLTRCNNTLADAQPNVPGQPSRVAVAFLNNVVTRIKAALANSGNVTQATYNELVAQYEQFLEYPRTTPLEAIDQNYLYVIRNAYYDDLCGSPRRQRRHLPLEGGRAVRKCPPMTLWYCDQVEQRYHDHQQGR